MEDETLLSVTVTAGIAHTRKKSIYHTYPESALKKQLFVNTTG
jgi:hypothetical protein